MKRTHVEALVDALRSGDGRALEELVPPLRARLTQVAKKRVERALVEEVVQETLTTLWEKRSTVQEPDHLLPFVFQVLRNKIGNSYARSRTARKRFVGDGSLRHLPEGNGAADPGTRVEAEELHRIIEEAIRRCSRESSVSGAVLELLWAGKTVSEIRAEFEEVSTSTLLSRVHRARMLLKRVLREEFGFDL